jgi:serine protease Do
MFLCVGIVFALAGGAVVNLEAADPRPKLDPPRLITDDSPLKKDIKAATSYAPVVKKVSPSIVNIYSTMPVKSDSMMRRYFGEEEQGSGRRRSKSRQAQSLGSGVIISADGYIMTANHVVEGATRVKVALAGDEEYEAKVIGADFATDIAVIKIDAKNLAALPIADSEKLEVGDAVLAVGNPFNVGRTVTMGIVSATGRAGFGINIYENFIQTDAAINPGNSGGALVDAQGRLVGINTSILSESGGFMGIGFAVPINMARYVLDQVIRDGKVTRGYLGIKLQPDLTLDLAKQFQLPNTSGALVTSVEPDSPAAKAGFKDGDFIVDLNGRKVTDMQQFRLIIAQSNPGQKVSVKILRDGKDKTLSATLAAQPEGIFGRADRIPGKERPEKELDALDGVEVTDLDSPMRKQLRMDENLQGAVVSNVDADSNAAEAGLKTGDVILEINRNPVKTAEDAVRLSESVKTERITLRIWRASGSRGKGSTFYLPPVDNAKRK